jgi:hypothetical protein
VEIEYAGKRRIRDVRAAYSYCASSDPRVHFGLGDATHVENVTVRWTNGEVESFGRFDADRVWKLETGAG